MTITEYGCQRSGVEELFEDVAARLCKWLGTELIRVSLESLWKDTKSIETDEGFFSHYNKVNARFDIEEMSLTQTTNVDLHVSVANRVFQPRSSVSRRLSSQVQGCTIRVQSYPMAMVRLEGMHPKTFRYLTFRAGNLEHP